MSKLKTQKSKVKIIFMGTPEFGAIILEGLCYGGYKPILVVTETDKPVGRKQILTPSPVKVIAQNYDIPIEQPKLIENCKLKIENLKPDLIIVAAYGQILTEEILKIPKYGCLNVHPSLLPKYRGPSPVQFAILNGDRETGITIILMDDKIDHGPILAQRKTMIRVNETSKQLQNRLALMGAKLLIDTLADWLKEKIMLHSQDEKRATYTKILKKEDGQIDWSKSAKEIERQVRAFDPFPGSFTFWQKSQDRKLRIKILKTRILTGFNKKDYPIGKTLLAPQNELCVQTGKGFLIIEKLQLEGKKEISSEEFLKGHPDFIGTKLC